MEFNKLPFNIKLLRNDTSALAGVLPVESLDIFSGENQFHPQGIYSSAIFGEVGTHDRQVRFGFIDLRTEMMHPKIFNELCKLKGLYKDILSGRIYATFDSELKDFVPSNVVDGDTGYAFFMSHFLEIVHATNDSNIRELRILLLDTAKDKCMYRYFPVLPAGLRDIDMASNERPKEDEINPLYRKLIRNRNTITLFSKNVNDPKLNTARWNIQSTGNQIYDYLEGIFFGKRGWLLDKVASRNIHGSTRNVTTAMDPAPLRLDSHDAITINHTIVGLHQYLKGTVELTIYLIRVGLMNPVLEFMPNMSYVVDPKTLNKKAINPSKFAVDNWGTEEGLEKLINGFEKTGARHKPILIDGNYAALVYRDREHFRVFYDIDDLPSHFSKANVKPITWCEMFYISVCGESNRVRATNTRYPIADLGSIYPSLLYLTTTTETENLVPLDENWKPIEGKYYTTRMPIAGKPFFDSQSVHVCKEPGLGLDHDGDKASLPIIQSKEAIEEIDKFLNSPESYLDQNGNLRYGINNKISRMVVESFTKDYYSKRVGNESIGLEYAIDNYFKITVSEDTKRNQITISNIDARELLVVISKVFGTSTVGKYQTLKVTGRYIVFYSFFLPDFYFIFETILADMRKYGDNTKTKWYIKERDLVEIMNLIVENTWFGGYFKTYPDILNYEKLKELKYTLLPPQMEALKAYSFKKQALRLNGYLLSAVVGSGKGLMSIAIATCLSADVVIVVCPKSLIDTVWINYVEEQFGGKKTIWASNHESEIKPGYDYYIFNYEALDRALELCKHYRFKKPVIILDESHNMNSSKSMRTNLFIEMCEASKSENIVLCSGTPVAGVGSETIPLFRVLDPLFTPKVEDNFKRIYGLSARRALEILNNRLGMVSYRIERNEVMADMDPIRTEIKVKVPDSTRYEISYIKAEFEKFKAEQTKVFLREMPKYERIYNKCLDIYKKTIVSKEKLELFKTYTDNISTIRSGYDPKTMLEISTFCNNFEKNEILPALPPELKKDFKEAKSVIKYYQLVILGRFLGGVLGRRRIELHSEMIAHSGIDKIVRESIKKTICFTDYVDTAFTAKTYFESKGFKPLIVTAETTNEISSIVKSFYEDKRSNPLIATVKSLSTGQTLICANTVIFLNPPFRSKDYEQCSARVIRIGQDTQVYLIDLALDTGEIPNLSNRMQDILTWSEDQVQAILGKDPIEKTKSEDIEDTLYLGLECLKDDYKSLIPFMQNNFDLDLSFIDDVDDTSLSIESLDIHYLGNEAIDGKPSTKILYHGSPNPDIKVIEPHYTNLMKKDCVFAGDYWIAVVCTCKWDDRDFKTGTRNGIPYILEKYKGAFNKLFNGGWVYEVSSKTFYHDSKLTNFEFVSDSPVDVIKKNFIADPIKELKELGVLILHYGEKLPEPKASNEDIHDDIHRAVHEAATSPLNDNDIPTDPMYKAGNYKKGHITLHGLDISIENPKHSVREGVDPDGSYWSTTMVHHFGYIKRSEGADGDHLDVFIGDHPDSEKVFVVNQNDIKTNEFDEHKVMLGFNTTDDAKTGYMRNYSFGWKGFDSITEITLDTLKNKIKEGPVMEPIHHSNRPKIYLGVGNESLKSGKPNAIIIKSNNIYNTKEPMKTWAHDLYQSIKDILVSKGYSVRIFRSIDYYTYPKDVDVVIAHSRGAGSYSVTHDYIPNPHIQYVEVKCKAKYVPKKRSMDPKEWKKLADESGYSHEHYQLSSSDLSHLHAIKEVKYSNESLIPTRVCLVITDDLNDYLTVHVVDQLVKYDYLVRYSSVSKYRDYPDGVSLVIGIKEGTKVHDFKVKYAKNKAIKTIAINDIEDLSKLSELN